MPINLGKNGLYTFDLDGNSKFPNLKLAGSVGLLVCVWLKEMLLRGQEHPHVAEMGYSLSVADILLDGENKPIMKLELPLQGHTAVKR